MKTNRSHHIPGEAVVFRTLFKDPEDVDEVVPTGDKGRYS